MSNDIRTDPEVLMVVTQMCDVSRKGAFEGRTGVPDPITMSVGDLAFWMMDQCNYKVFRDKLYNEVGPRDSGSYTDGYLKATPEQWIRAACKAWDSRAAQRRE